jgi:hypothetical protein
MKHKPFSALLLLTGISLISLLSCSRDPLERLYGTWKGKTRIDQDITITIRPDSTIAIETEVDSIRQIKRGTYRVVDRRLRILLTSTETIEGDSVKTQRRLDQDEAVYTLTSAKELVLRRGEMAIVLQRTNNLP